MAARAYRAASFAYSSTCHRLAKSGRITSRPSDSRAYRVLRYPRNWNALLYVVRVSTREICRPATTVGAGRVCRPCFCRAPRGDGGPVIDLVRPVNSFTNTKIGAPFCSRRCARSHRMMELVTVPACIGGRDVIWSSIDRGLVKRISDPTHGERPKANDLKEVEALCCRAAFLSSARKASVSLTLRRGLFLFSLNKRSIIIGVWGGPRRVYASFKFFLYTLLVRRGIVRDRRHLSRWR